MFVSKWNAVHEHYMIHFHLCTRNMFIRNSELEITDHESQQFPRNSSKAQKAESRENYSFPFNQHLEINYNRTYYIWICKIHVWENANRHNITTCGIMQDLYAKYFSYDKIFWYIYNKNVLTFENFLNLILKIYHATVHLIHGIIILIFII